METACWPYWGNYIIGYQGMHIMAVGSFRFFEPQVCGQLQGDTSKIYRVHRILFCISKGGCICF